MENLNRVLIGTGHFTWDAVERRTDRYGSVRLKTDKDKNVLFDTALDKLEGKRGRLVAEVLIPVKSSHPGDIARGIKPSTPDKGENVVLGHGELFIEHRGQAEHEKAAHERADDEMHEAMNQAFAKMGIKVKLSKSGQAGNPLKLREPPAEVYDLVGLKPANGRETDWLFPRSFYRLHMSKVNLYFEEENGP